MSSNQTLEEFLHDHRVAPSSQCTHTSLIEPKGKFYVPTYNLETFYNLYEKAIKNNRDVCITEVQRPYIPILIDLDFRACCKNSENSENTTEIPKNLYSHEQIQQFIDSLRSVLDTLIDYTYADVYIMEKKQKLGYDNKNRLKDGLHIQIPDIVTEPITQYILRDNMLQTVKEIFSNIHNKASEIYDEQVIYDNPWIMYGGKKPNNVPYKVTNIFRIEKLSSFQTSISPHDYSLSYMIQTLSLQNKCEKTVVEYLKKEKPENLDKGLDISNLDYYNKKKNDKDTKKNTLTIKPTENNSALSKCQTTEKDVQLAHELVGILANYRADDYNEWIRVGWCLHNISNDLLQTWIEFSQRSSKYNGDDSECRRLWVSMRDNGLGMGSLRHWAKTDDKDAYNEIIRTIADDQIEKSINDPSHFQLAYVISEKYKDSYVCTSVKNNQWFYFNGYRWKPEYGSKLNWNISFDIYNMYMQKDKEYSDSLVRDSQNMTEEQINVIHKKKERTQTIAKNLRNTSFKEKLFKELRYLMFDETFIEQLDEQKHLLAFDNCVVDLNTLEIRDIAPEDMISKSCGYEFEWFDESHNPTIREVKQFIESIFIDEDIRHYALKVFACSLHGEIQEQLMHILTGKGSNGKSALLEFIKHTLGDYYHQIGVQYFTEKRQGANQAQSDIAQARGKRILTTEEPDNTTSNAPLNTSVIKSLASGGDIRARDLYSPSSSFQLQASVFIACNNLPTVNETDYGTWRRLKVIPFNTTFKEELNPDNDYERLIDRNLDNKIKSDEWKNAFMNILLEYYSIYKKERLKNIPDAVNAMTTKYQQDNDIIFQFIENFLEKAPENENGNEIYIPSSQIVDEYTNFCRRNGKAKPKNNKDVGEQLSVYVPVVFKPNKKWYIYGYRFIEDDD